MSYVALLPTGNTPDTLAAALNEIGAALGPVSQAAATQTALNALVPGAPVSIATMSAAVPTLPAGTTFTLDPVNKIFRVTEPGLFGTETWTQPWNGQ